MTQMEKSEGAPSTAEVDGAARQGESKELPLFYERPVLLSAARHGKAGLRPHRGFNFARHTNAIVVTGTELALVARHYPIVFSASAPVLPFAVVGFRESENLFVSAEGEWREDCYVPSYVRRYPFVLMKERQSRRSILCVDEAADRFGPQAEQPFFVDGKPSPMVREAMHFCEIFQAQYEDTLRFGEWLEQNGLLEDRAVRTELDNGNVFTLRGFRLVSPEKVRALGDEQVLYLHKKGWSGLLHFHFQSLNSWGSLGRLARRAQSRAA